MKIYIFNVRKALSPKLPFKILCFILLFGLSVHLISEATFGTSEYEEVLLKLSEERTVIIDAGHGGGDSGAVGKNGRLEKDLNLEMAFTLGGMLAERGFAVIYTRSTDKLLYTDEEDIKGIRKISDLKNRCKIGAEYPNAIFISIHMNSYKTEKYSGFQVYYTPNNAESKALALSLQTKVKDTVQNDNNRKIKSGESIYILNNVPNVSVLVECGFLSNTAECEKLSEKEYQKQLSFAIACGIIDYAEK